MSVITDIGAALIAGSHCTSSTLFYGYLPPSPASCVMVSVYGGKPDDLLGYEYPDFQVQVRDENQQTAMTKILAIRTTLTITNTTKSSTWYALCRAKRPPYQLGRDPDTGLFKTACDFEVIKKI